MALIIEPNGEVMFHVEHHRLLNNTHQIFPSGLFCAVPILEGTACGWDIYVDDEGLLLNLDLNSYAAILSGHVGSLLVGPAFVCSQEEMQETELVEMIDQEAKRRFENRLRQLTSEARKEQAELN